MLDEFLSMAKARYGELRTVGGQVPTMRVTFAFEGTARLSSQYRLLIEDVMGTENVTWFYFSSNPFVDT